MLILSRNIQNSIWPSRVIQPHNISDNICDGGPIGYKELKHFLSLGDFIAVLKSQKAMH
jgi:hypothetical protein